MHHDPTNKELRLFGICFGAALIIIGMRLFFKDLRIASYLFLSCGTLIELSGIFLLRFILRPVKALMDGILKSLLFILTRSALIIIFYCVFTPVGLVMRLFGNDLLHRKFERTKVTYWQDCPVRTFDPEHYTKQF